LLAQLLEHPAWPILRKVSEERKRRHFQDIAAALIAGVDVSKDLIEWKRGYFSGMKFLLDRPQAKAKELEKELRKREEVTLDA
jgi:hypothetical protein